MFSKIAASAALGAALLVPAITFAQTPTTGLLNVYVQVINQTGYTYAPATFTVAVSGQSPAPASFQGSIQGTLVTINPGTYSVTLVNPSAFSTSYSVGCNSSIVAGGTQTCVITVNAGSYNYSNSYVYPYTQTAQPLTCRTDTPTVGIGQSARFTAVGGMGGTYNWRTPTQNYPNVGPVLTTTLEGSGAQAVTVTNASQSATCAITVTSGFFTQPTPTPLYSNPSYNTYNTYPSNTTYPYYGTQPPAPTYSAYAYPRFPNTGLEPATSAQLAFALVLLLGAAIFAYPYVRKAFTLAVR